VKPLAREVSDALRGGDVRVGDVIRLGNHASFRPQLDELARGEVAVARERLGLNPIQFADALGELLGWTPTAEAVEAWEERSTPPGDVVIASQLLIGNSTSADSGARRSLDGMLVERFADVARVFPNRSAFTAAYPAHALFATAQKVAIAGLSLNLVCQDYADQGLRQLIEGGARMKCLFLKPYGGAAAAREREEGYPAGRLSALTDLNIQILLRLRAQLPGDIQHRLELATYDETVRFNVVLVDDSICVLQPYLPALRGVDSPTVVLRRIAAGGLFPIFNRLFEWLCERSSTL
jgi:hypothetical protein